MCVGVWTYELWIECRSFGGHRLLNGLWKVMPSISYLQPAITTYNWNSFKKFICHQPYFEWYPGILFYKWFGNQTHNRLSQNITMLQHAIHILDSWIILRQTDKHFAIGSKPVPTIPNTTEKSWPEKWLNSVIAVL